MDVIIGEFYIKFFVRSSKDGNLIISRGKFLNFKFSQAEFRTSILWVAIFFISWIYLEIFYVIENNNTPDGQLP
jgi:hypothetical protein